MVRVMFLRNIQRLHSFSLLYCIVLMQSYSWMIGERSTAELLLSPDSEPLTYIIHQNLKQCRLNNHQLNGKVFNID